MFSREQIDAALAHPDPYAALGYDPAQSDSDGTGTHCTHVMDIAAGNGLAPGSAPGVAPEADLVCVHLKGDDTQLQDTLGDSVRVLEAIRFIVDCAGERPVVVNLSLGKTGGPHDHTPLVTQALDMLLDEKPGRAVVMSTGNYFSANLHSDGQLRTGEQTDLHWTITQRDDEMVEMEVWYPGSDRFAMEMIDPFGNSLGIVGLGEDRVIREGDRIIASVYHRAHDPNNGDHQVDIFLWPDAAIGAWITRLHGEEVTDGRYHAWIERSRPTVQARFEPASATPTYSTGTICNGQKTIAVGAYDARHTAFPLAPFSSAGPTRDGRPMPVVAAPGVAIRAARSSYPTAAGRFVNGLTVKSGTSMAAPHVSGVIALMFEAAGEWRLTAEQTRSILVATARPAPVDSQHQRYGAGRVDAAAAVKRVLELKSAGAPSSATLPTMALREELEMEPQPLTAQLESTEITLETIPPADPVQRLEPSTQVDPETTLFSELDESCDERFQAVGESAEAAESLHPLQRQLAPLLPQLLLERGDIELQRRNETGDPIYDKRQPLYFAPNGRSYATGPGQFHYHAANFVYNTAYYLGYDVPVYPPSSATASEGEAYLNLAATFQALAGERDGDLSAYLNRFFVVVAWPGQPAPPTMQAGDLLLRGVQPDTAYGRLAIIVDPQLRDMADPYFLEYDQATGKGLHCIGAGLTIQDRQARAGCALTDEQGILLEKRMVIRFKASTIDPARVALRLQDDPDFQRWVEQAHWAVSLRSAIKVAPEQESAEASPDSSAAVPGFTAAKRATISSPILNAAQNAAAITWNTRKHPGVSGVSPSDIRTALAAYVDFTAVSTAINDFNTRNPTAPLAPGAPPVDAVFVEAVHQFQAKCFFERAQVDGKIGESTLDSLGFIQRTGLNSVDSANTRAQRRLDNAATQISTATSGAITAANWFQNMVNPSFLGWRFSNGIHIVLVRKLRLAENHLLAQSTYRGMTPIELGRALYITEDHKGARPSAASNSVHTFGLAVDIQYASNPWVAGQHVDRDSNGALTSAGQATQRANEQFTRAVNRAALLISGVTVNFTPAYLYGLRTNATNAIYDILTQRSADLRAYLRMNGDPAAIRGKLSERQSAGTTGVLNTGENLAAAATRWQTMIADDLANLRGVDSNFTGRDPLNGFINLSRDLVIALRDIAGLAWGAVDFGGECGDMMHFDDRLTGVGRVAHNSH
jgi:subtilisin family serine protease